MSQVLWEQGLYQICDVTLINLQIADTIFVILRWGRSSLWNIRSIAMNQLIREVNMVTFSADALYPAVTYGWWNRRLTCVKSN